VIRSVIPNKVIGILIGSPLPRGVLVLELDL